MAEDEWVLLTSEEKDGCIKMILWSDVGLTALPSEEPEMVLQQVSIMGALNFDEDDEEAASVSRLSMLAEAAMIVSCHEKETVNQTTMIPLKEFKTYLINQPDATVEEIYGKSIELLGKNNAIVLEPSCDEKARMVESRR